MPDIRICEYCKKNFITNPARIKRFCNRFCASKRIISLEHRLKNSEANKGRKIPQEVREKIRKARLGTHPSEETRKKLSASMSKRMVGNKLGKGRKFSVTQRKKMSDARKGKKFTKEHIDNLIKTRPRGENHSAWKGGITPINTQIRRSTEGRLWIYSVFVRDNFTCQKCGNKGSLNAHHIYNFADFPELRMAIDNGITFCKKCHKNFHSRFGNKTNKDYLEEFLKS